MQQLACSLQKQATSHAECCPASVLQGAAATVQLCAPHNASQRGRTQQRQLTPALLARRACWPPLKGQRPLSGHSVGPDTHGASELGQSREVLADVMTRQRHEGRFSGLALQLRNEICCDELVACTVSQADGPRRRLDAACSAHDARARSDHRGPRHGSGERLREWTRRCRCRHRVRSTSG